MAEEKLAGCKVVIWNGAVEGVRCGGDGSHGRDEDDIECGIVDEASMVSTMRKGAACGVHAAV